MEKKSKQGSFNDKLKDRVREFAKENITGKADQDDFIQFSDICSKYGDALTKVIADAINKAPESKRGEHGRAMEAAVTMVLSSMVRASSGPKKAVILSELFDNIAREMMARDLLQGLFPPASKN